MSESWIGIGANLGEARAAFDAAWRELGRHPAIQLRTRSGIYETRPVGAQAGGTFSNAVFSLGTTLRPLEVLDLLQSVESRLGRSRGLRWGPRSIDLDLLFVDQLVLNSPRLTLPHPAAWYRRFVIDPLAEVAPTLSHPVLGETVAQLRARLTTRPFVVACQETALPSIMPDLPDLQSRFPGVKLVRAGSASDRAAAFIRLKPDDSAAPLRDGIPVGDLTATPGAPTQRVVDFLTSVFDDPRRIGDW
jgi:2-amino-4-hydroxy-6-hydroxymethyldihydropteridine diphosphokinase